MANLTVYLLKVANLRTVDRHLRYPGKLRSHRRSISSSSSVCSTRLYEYWGVIENKHSTDAEARTESESARLIHGEGETCSDIGRALVAMTLLPDSDDDDDDTEADGRGLHSSTFQLNLSRI